MPAPAAGFDRVSRGSTVGAESTQKRCRPVLRCCSTKGGHDEPQYFAYPNGPIYLHTGLLARMDNEAQLATLLGHEMTHATHRTSV